MDKEKAKLLLDDFEATVQKALADINRLDFLQQLTTGYGKGWILRQSSTGRGWRLHETSSDHASPTVREAIDEVIQEYINSVEEDNGSS